MSHRVTVVVPDATRPFEPQSQLAPLLAKFADADVTVLIGLGLHRRLVPDELARYELACRATGATVAQHDLADVVEAPSGWRFARAVVEADEIVCVGVVEPHQYAGFSGGAKAVAIGCADERGIAEMHSLRMLAACGGRVGRVNDNPFQERLWELVEGLPLTAGVFCVPGHPEPFAGPLREAWDAAVRWAEVLHFRPVRAPVPWARVRVTGPKAVNFYQACRAATYVSLVDASAVEPGGWIALEASCPEGLGLGDGERAFARALGRRPSELLDELRGEAPPATSGGAQRAYVLALLLEQHRLALVGPELKPLTSWGVPTFPTWEEAKQKLAFGGDGLNVENAFHALPRLSG